VTLEEARDLITSTVFWNKDGESLMVRIVNVTGIQVQVRGDGNNLIGESARYQYVRPDELSPIPYLELVAATQAAFNEFTFAVLVDTGWDFTQTDSALDALRNLNWAAGLSFENNPPPRTTDPERFARDAVLAGWRLWNEMDRQVARARGQAKSPAQGPEIAGPALVYLVTHADLGAVKVGVSEPRGSRIAQHRRRGWDLVAAFQVRTGRAAFAIEREILQWWRAKLSLPVHVKSPEMPQGGYTETVAMNRIDLPATVARVCELALKPEARPHLA
jgi:hypothetical protein